ncbi:MAG: BamA/TamA family outer membrane protein [Candidatus Zixiibacteriota bacterium]|nr:MAG: BamA/TamA family outer membrane protein [candidate division Zixibacteria bacterium]
MKKYLLSGFMIVLLWSSGSGQTIDRETLRWMRDRPIIDSIEITIEPVTIRDSITASDVRAQMYSKKWNPLHWLRGERRSHLQRETLDRDTLEIKYLYLTRGFLGVKVGETFEMDQKDSSAIVKVHIDPGREYIYGQTGVTGDFKPAFNNLLARPHRKLKESKPVNLLAVQQATFDMKTVLANNGYPYAKVSFEFDTVTAPPEADLTFKVQTGSKVHFGEVEVVGSKNYPESVARRELTFKKGDLYRRKDILDSQRRLFESGYFSYLQLSQAGNNGDSLNPDFQLRIRERKPKFVNIKTGAGQSELKDLIWDFSLGVGKRNFFGSRRVSLTSDYSFSLGQESRLITHRYRLRYTEPWLLGIRMPLTLTGEYEPPIKSTLQDYTITQWTVSASTTKWYELKIKITAGIEYNEVKITDVPEETVQELKEAEGISVRRRMFTTYRRDSRDNIFIARSGSLTDLAVEFVGGFLGGDDDYYKIEASWARYRVVWPGWTWATRFKGGYATEFGDSPDVPTEERLYLGGANTIRGFRENTLGPLREDGSAEGARISLICNQEFRWKTIQVLRWIPLKVFETLPLYQSIFLDVGNGFRNGEEIAWENLAVSYGAGFQIVSPAGPIRIDYARRVKTEKYDFDSRWHFTILYAF